MSRALAAFVAAFAVLALLVALAAGPAQGKPRGKGKRATPATMVGKTGTLRLGAAPRRRVVRGRAAPGPAAPPVAPTAAPGSATPTPGAPAPNPTPSPRGPLPRAVSVTTADRTPGVLRLSLSDPVVAAGVVTVEFNNAFAEDAHDLHVVQEGGADTFAFSELEPGAAASRDLRLAAGAYRLLCALPGHAEAGMQARLRVED